MRNKEWILGRKDDKFWVKLGFFLFFLFSCGRWIELEHGTEAAVLFRQSSPEKKQSIGP